MTTPQNGNREVNGKDSIPMGRDPGHLAGALSAFIVNYATMIAAIAIAITVVAGLFASALKVDTGIEALMPDGVPSVTNLEKVLEKTGSFSSAMVVITSPEPDAAIAFAEEMRQRALKDLPWVGSADYAEDFSVFERHKLLYLETEDLRSLNAWAEDRVRDESRARLEELADTPINIHLRSAPAYSGVSRASPDQLLKKYGDGASPSAGRETQRLFRSEDGDILLLVVWPNGASINLTQSRRIIEDLNGLAAEIDPRLFHPQMTVEVGGRIYNRVVQFDAVIEDLSVGGYWTLGLILVVLLLYFRSVTAVVLLTLPLSAGIVWTFGLASVAIGQLNLVTIFLALVLFGLGIDFGIHNLARYREARTAGRSPEEAICDMIRHTGTASLLAGATTAVGFLALTATDFRAFSEFGFIAGTGIILGFVAMYTLMPALLVLAEKRGLCPIGNHREWNGQLPLPRLPAKAVLIGATTLLAASAILATRVQFEDNFGRLQAERTEAHKAIQAKISKVFPDGTDRAILVVDTLEEVNVIRRYFDRYIRNDTDTPTIQKIETIFSYIPDKAAQDERLRLIQNIRQSLGDEFIDERAEELGTGAWRDYLDIDELAVGDLPAGLRRLYTGLPGTDGYLIYIFNSVSMYDFQLAKNFSDDIRTINVGNRTYHPAAEGLIFVDMLELMKGDALLAVALVSVVVLVMILILFRNLRTALIVIAPTAAGLLALFGFMGGLGLKLSIFNMIVLPALIGIAVDNGVHMVRRYQEAGDLTLALRQTGAAAGAATLTTMFGFAGLAGARMGGLSSLGEMAILGFGLCLLATWFLLPALIEIVAEPAQKVRGRE